jgi:hypothetical protein
MTNADIKPLQGTLEAQEQALILQTDQSVQGLSQEESRKKITEVCAVNTDNIINQWWQLGATIVSKYSDGYINLPDGHYSTPPSDPTRMIGYPAPWLNKTNYGWGPTTYEMKPSFTR